MSSPYDKNLLKNNCGQYKNPTKWWKIHKRFYREFTVGAAGPWIVEKTPQGTDALPEDADFEGETCCFASSSKAYICAKSQTVKLCKKGIKNEFLDEHQPKIHFSDWYAVRRDSRAEYKLTAKLLNEKKKVLATKKIGWRAVKIGDGGNWNKVEITFEKYGPGVRFVELQHESKCAKKNYQEHHGVKVAGSVVKVEHPFLSDSS